MFSRNALIAVIYLALIASSAIAEKANMTPEELAETATHIVNGKVNAIYERKSKEGNWNYTHYLTEVRVIEPVKGEGLKKDELVYIRYWRRGWAGKGPVPTSTSGHRGLPSEGDVIHVYLAKNAYDGFGTTKDGGFNVIGANGVENLKPAVKSE